MRRFGWMVLSVVVGLGLEGRAHAERSGTLVVAYKSGDAVSFIDLTLSREVARVSVGRAPHEIAISPDGATVLVGEYGPDDAHGGTIATIDVASASLTGRVDVGAKTRPHSVVFLPDGTRAVVTLQERDEIAIVDLGAKRVLRTLPTGGRESHMVRLSPDATRAYVTSREGRGTLSVVSLDGSSEPVVIETGAGAEGIAVTPDGSEVWVLDRDLDRVSIVDTTALRVVQRIDARPSPNRIAIGASGRAVVTNGTSSESIVQYLNLYGVEARSRLEELPLRGGVPHAGAFGILVVGDDLFISDTNGGRVLAFDLANLGEPRVLVTGLEKERPDGMVWTEVRVLEEASAAPGGSEAKELRELDREAPVR